MLNFTEIDVIKALWLRNGKNIPTGKLRRLAVLSWEMVHWRVFLMVAAARPVKVNIALRTALESAVVE